MGIPRRPKSNKNPPILSHEFIIQNHADIVSCVAMVFVIGLMFQATAPMSSIFVALQHNITLNGTADAPDTEIVGFYTYGVKDILTVFFYTLLWIIGHAVIQEYILDKLNRKMHLSKVKHSKFSESGQLLIFYLASAGWGADLILRENYINGIHNLWQGYPHNELPFFVKFYFILQISYWVHSFPELYFQKIKKDEMFPRVRYAVLTLVFITAAYMLNFTRVALCMLVLHYIGEFVFHVCRLMYFSEQADVAATGFKMWNLLFVLVRLGTITLAVLTFWYGLEQSGQEDLDLAVGNFNTKLFRINSLAAVCLLQAWMMWNFIMFHLRLLREKTAAATKARPPSPKKRKGKGEEKSDVDELPEVDQNSATENGTAKLRGKAKKN